jgi:hypothetical protein
MRTSGAGSLPLTRREGIPHGSRFQHRLWHREVGLAGLTLQDVPGPPPVSARTWHAMATVNDGDQDADPLRNGRHPNDG